MWGRYKHSKQWALLTWFGTAGALTIVTATDGGVAIPAPLEINGIDEVWPEIDTVTGVGEVCDVWLAGSH